MKRCLRYVRADAVASVTAPTNDVIALLTMLLFDELFHLSISSGGFLSVLAYFHLPAERLFGTLPHRPDAENAADQVVGSEEMDWINTVRVNSSSGLKLYPQGYIDGVLYIGEYCAQNLAILVQD